MPTSTPTQIAAASPDEAARLSFFPPEMPVSYDTAGNVASRFGDPSWNMSSMSTDGTSVQTLYFYEADSASASVRIPADRDQSFRIIVTADSGIVTGVSGLS